MLDDSLITETLSVINAPPVVPRCGGSTSSPPSFSKDVVGQCPRPGEPCSSSKGSSPKRVLRPSSSVVIRGCSLELVQPSVEVMGLDCSQVLSIAHSLPTDGVQLKGDLGNQQVEVSEIVQCAMEMGPLLGISCGGNEK